jgi:hypothetical protein
MPDREREDAASLASEGDQPDRIGARKRGERFKRFLSEGDEHPVGPIFRLVFGRGTNGHQGSER